MWTYRQSTGELHLDGSFEGMGYSGHGDGVNNPTMEAVRGVGPVPAGRWTIGPPRNHPPLGSVVMALMPVGFDPHGRSGFFMHGDNSKLNHTGSDGCIVMGRSIRQAVADSGVRALTVVV